MASSQVSYAIGVAEPLSVTVFDYGTGSKTSSELNEIVKKNFDLRYCYLIQKKKFNWPSQARPHCEGLEAEEPHLPADCQLRYLAIVVCHIVSKSEPSSFRSLRTWHLHMGAAKESELLGFSSPPHPFSFILFHSSSFQIPQSPYNPHFVASRDSCHFCLRAPTWCVFFSFKPLNNFTW